MNSFNADIILENDRVLLRPLELQDEKYLLPFAINEPDLWQYSLIPANGQSNMLAYIQNAILKKSEQTEYPFIVWDKKVSAYAGSTRFYDIQIANKTMQLGYTWYGKDFQGTGLNKNCKYLMLQFAFEQCKMERVEFRADSNNARSIKAMQGIGCTVEGILRSNVAKPNSNERRNSIVLSILKEEWFNSIKEKLLLT